MTSIFETYPQLAGYQPSLLALCLLCLMVMVQSFLTAPLAFIKAEQVPGIPLRGDHSALSFRVLRTYANSVENLPAFGLILGLAILLGASAFWVNLLAIGHVGFRFLYWAIYYSGIGRVAGGPRTMAYVAGILCNIALAVMCIIVLI